MQCKKCQKEFEPKVVKADMVFTDPPYNVDYGATMKDKLRGTDDRTIENDNMEALAFRDFLRDAFVHIVARTTGACYICMSSSELGSLKWEGMVINLSGVHG